MHVRLRWGSALVSLALFVALMGSSLPAGAASPTAKPNAFTLSRLVADHGAAGAHVDANLVNPWGMAASATSPWWVANNESDTSTIYQGDGTASALVVSVPGEPSGVVFNGGSAFVLPGSSTRASFLFATLNGTIDAWAAPLGTGAQVVVGTPAAVYTGLAIASRADGDHLYAANFAQAEIDVFDGNFTRVFASGRFEDPGLPSGYRQSNIQNLGGTLFVTYAQAVPSGRSAVVAAGDGIVDAFDSEGNFLHRVATGGPLNAPWGLAIAPAGFGPFGGDLLVGNHGNGRINAYRWTGTVYKHAGVLRDAAGKVLKIPGLRGIEFGNGGNAGPVKRLFFTAGPKHGTHGLFGSIKPA